MIAIAEETLDLRGAAFSAALWLLMPTFSLPNARVALAGQPSARLKCSPTTPMLRIGSTKSEARNPKQILIFKIPNFKHAFGKLEFKIFNLFRISDLEFRISSAKHWHPCLR